MAFEACLAPMHVVLFKKLEILDFALVVFNNPGSNLLFIFTKKESPFVVRQLSVNLCMIET